MSQTLTLIVGLVLGALLSGGVTFILDIGREKRGARAAARVVQAEMTEFAIAAQTYGDKGEDYPLPVETPAWQAHGAALASVMTTDE